MQPDDKEVFLERPFALIDAWVEVVVPSFATLLSYPSRKLLRYSCPVARAELFDAFGEDLVLGLRPVAHDEACAVGQLEPARVALDFRFASQQFADPRPRILAKLGDVR